MHETTATAVLGLGLLLAAGAGTPAAAQEGEALFRDQCATCHAVPPAGIEAKVTSGRMAGPDLPEAITGREEAWIRDFLHKEAELEGSKHPKAFKGSDEELSALIAWLESLSGDGS